jgi:broad specificity phosphatase PhoE
MGEMFNGLMDVWIPEVAKTYADILASDARFPEAKSLLARFDRAADWWAKRHSKDDVKALTETANELAAAAAILDKLDESQTLAYEPPLKRTKKTIDFLVMNSGRPHMWIDVKTVAPEWVETDCEWQRFEAIRSQLPQNTNLIVDKELGGAGVGGQMLKSRWSLYTRAAEIEEKIEDLTDEEKAPVSVLFCSSGFAWHVDTLEDFADHYRNGKFRQDDWAATMLPRYMEDTMIAFKRTLAGFHYLERGQFEVMPKDFRMFVRGPCFGV